MNYNFSKEERRIAKKFGGLTHAEWENLAPWNVWYSDLSIIVYHTLTEPTCPNVKLVFELPHRSGLEVVCYNNGATIQKAIDSLLKDAKILLPKLTVQKINGEFPVAFHSEGPQKIPDRFSCTGCKYLHLEPFSDKNFATKSSCIRGLASDILERPFISIDWHNEDPAPNWCPFKVINND